ncbi:MAG: hypothetical protein ABIL58_19045 [Pseudomonadota bacterium]
MKERIVSPQNPQEVLTELTCPNKDEIDEFLKAFPAEILQFSESFSTAYKGYLELNHTTLCPSNTDGEITQKDYVTFFTYQILDNLFTSTKTLLSGFQTASGNLLRQATEGIAVVILLSLDHTIQRTERRKGKEKKKTFHFYQSFKNEKAYALSHLAIRLLLENQKLVGITDYGIEMLGIIKEYSNKHSHPTFFSTSSFISYGMSGKMYLGGSFDKGKIDWYRSELQARIGFCDKLPALIRGLVKKVRDLQ